jgi:alpha-1,2-mannosyltransferase
VVSEQAAIETRERKEPGRMPSLHRITWTLMAFSFVNLAGSTLLTWIVSPRDLGATSAAYAARFALRHAADDSWKPMQLALEEFRATRGKSIYESVFFEQKIKFQYPPSSLLGLDVLQGIAGQRVDLRQLNNISWVLVLALAGIVPAIYLRALREFNPDLWSRFTRVDLRLQAAILCLMTLTFYPVTRGFVLGQIQTWLTCLFAGAVLAWVSGREGSSGVLIGLIVSVKPQLGVLLLCGAVHRRRRFLIGSAVTVLALEAVSLWRYGLENHLDYLRVLSYMATHGESFFANQSVNGLLARLLHTGNNLEWDARNFPPFQPVVYYGTLISSLAMIGLALRWRWKSNRREIVLLKFCAAALLLTMASPIAWEHHYGILAPIYGAVLVFLCYKPERLRGTTVGRASAGAGLQSSQQQRRLKPARRLKSAPLSNIVVTSAVLKEQAHRIRILCLAASYVLCGNAFPFTNYVADTGWNFLQSYLFAGAALLLLTLYLHTGYTSKPSVCGESINAARDGPELCPNTPQGGI